MQMFEENGAEGVRGEKTRHSAPSLFHAMPAP